ncbi:F-box protein At3g07870-like [Papaver somniferum]|uniref:F-box protein At3g07870-like n=1 Tax=Papaver somniferum TaxID=3469 RepID=UPI000E6FFDBC|nr:F-box protein At3g07870-like [Papaver somniferum]
MADQRMSTPKFLPEEITLNIFTRLPADLVLDCKLVRKTWRNFVKLFHSKTTYFAYQHLWRHCGRGLIQQHEQLHNLYHNDFDSAKLSFVFWNRDAQALDYMEYHEEGESNRDKQLANYYTRKINFKFPLEAYEFVGTCNGLICISVKTAHVSYREEPEPKPALYICNPITKEFISLPGLGINKEKLDKNDGVHIVHGFGYDPQTNKYKVVRVLYFGVDYKNSFKGSHVEVYTLGSGCGWRSAGETNYFVDPSFGAASICVNGALHWILGRTPKIVVFDLADEKFHLLPAPPGVPYCGKLFVMKGCLCLGEAYRKLGQYWKWDLWYLKNNEEESSSSSCQEGEHYYSFWSWRKEFRTLGTIDFKESYCEPFAITNKGEVLLFANYLGDISLHNPETNTATPKQIRNFFEYCSPGMEMPIPHINSFVSLNALGAENVRTNIVD